MDTVSGKIYFAEEVLVKDGPQQDLYNRAKNWFLNSEQGKKVLILDDYANGVLIGNCFILMSEVKNHKKQPDILRGKIKIEVEDDRYWYSITDLAILQKPFSKEVIIHKNLPEYLPLETVLFTPNNKVVIDNEKLPGFSLAIATQNLILIKIKELKKAML